MAQFVVVAGERANHLEGVAVGNVAGSDENAFFPFSNLERAFALDPWRPGVHIAPAASNVSVVVNKGYIDNPGAENSPLGPLVSDPASWIVALDDPGDPAGSIEVVSTPVDVGLQAFKFAAATGEGGVEGAAMYQEIKVRAGEPGTVTVRLRGDGANGIARARAFIVETGQYLTSGGALSLTPQDFATRTTATYATTTINWTPTAYTKQWPTGIWTVRFTAYIDASNVGEAFVDEFDFWPHTNGVAVIGHNIMPRITSFVVQRSSDGSSWTTEHTFTVITPNMYALLSATRTERYWRFLANGENGEPLWYGQLWLFQKLAFTRSPSYGFEERMARDFKPQATTAGATRRYFKEDTPRTDLIFEWRHPTEADYQELRDRVFRQGRLGQWPALIIRSTAMPESAHMVNIPGEYLTTFFEAAKASDDGRPRDVGEMVFPGLAYPVFTG